ncbi:MAG TPA: hypothetical protein VHM70_22075 [Polyangiaceae bacterium]|jgi:hypothetical protein|nr:hypothetical protein [Polyangiaceae bacterium]
MWRVAATAAIVLPACDKPRSQSTHEQAASVTGSVQTTASQVAPAAHTPSVSSNTALRASATLPNASASVPNTKRASVPDSCTSICEVNRELGCGATEQVCQQRCLQMIEQVPECATAMRAALSCFAEHSKQDWHCEDSEGMPALKDGLCDDAQADVMRCVQQQQ